MRGSVLRQCPEMLERTVALVGIPAVVRRLFMKLSHQGIATDFGYDRRRTYSGRALITPHDGHHGQRLPHQRRRRFAKYHPRRWPQKIEWTVDQGSHLAQR